MTQRDLVRVAWPFGCADAAPCGAQGSLRAKRRCLVSHRIVRNATLLCAVGAVLALGALSGCAHAPEPSPPPAVSPPPHEHTLPPDVEEMLDEENLAELDPDHSAFEWEARVLSERVQELEQRNELLRQHLEEAERLYREAQRHIADLEQTRQEKVEREEERLQELEDRQRELQEQRKTTQHLNYRLGGMSKELQDLRNQFAAMQLERRAEAARYEQAIRELREKLDQRGIE